MFIPRTPAKVLLPPVTVVLLLLLHCVVFHVDAHTCSSCDRATCTPAVNCTAGVTLDVCDCCWVCAKAKGEICKGPHDLAGKCGEGLDCIVRVEAGKSRTGHEQGTCQDTQPFDCIKKVYSGCNIVNNKQCVCQKLESCSDIKFQYHNQAECEAEISSGGDKCKDVVCPPSITCPADSYERPHLVTDECCSIPQGCGCLPETSCHVPTCNGTEILKKIKPGEHKPGSCCPVYQCVREATCIHDGNVHKNLEKWDDKCYTYSCRNGIVNSMKKPCNSSHLNCGIVATSDGCCPVCTGCVSPSGNFYNNNDKWKEDDCTSCDCENGRVHCHAEMCHVTCKSPVNVPGQCCAICPEPDIVTIPPYCSHLENCSEDCKEFQKDSNGCYMCECKPDDCDLECHYGYMKDSLGQPFCLCAEKKKETCPPFNCKKKCPDGYKLDKNNCMTCRCNHCNKLKGCSKYCPNGFKIDKIGCHTCSCLDDNAGPRLSRCRSSDGRWYEHGQSWNDGCRNCFCKDGQELCSLIFCPNPSCKHPTVYKGECCTKCLGDDFAIVNSNLSVCHADNDQRYLQGEIWNIDRCTSCICHEGRFLCETKQCPPVPCDHPVFNDGCCPKCLDIPLLSAKDEKMPCYTENGQTVYPHGSQWRASACQSCICDSAKIKCFSETCPNLLCSRPLLQKNKCCPICPDQLNSTSYCVYNDTFYADGEQWMIDKCTNCDCYHGVIKCIQKKCSKMCSDQLYSSHPCCSDCRDKHLGNHYQLYLIGFGVVLAVALLIVSLGTLCYFCKKRSHEKSQNSMIFHTKDDLRSECKLLTRLPDITYSGKS